MALWPIHVNFRIKKLIVSTYQAASGAGAEGMDELLSGTRAKLNNEAVENKVFVHPLPFNLIPHIDKFLVSNHLLSAVAIQSIP
jgi:aspartate-semialdehyde dehydrogenase